jgi:UDP-N-acetylmuramoyl-tripeptide--D-alanyl-D-alanine ligase
VPLTLARMPAEADFAVIEVGMNAPGEIAPLARLARPHVALVTTVEAVHLAAFRDIRGIAREKAAIVLGLEPGGVAVINRDIPTYPILLAAARRAGRLVDAGDIAMVKGSLGSRVGLVVEAIKRMGEARPAETPAEALEG